MVGGGNINIICPLDPHYIPKSDLKLSKVVFLVKADFPLCNCILISPNLVFLQLVLPNSQRVCIVQLTK